MEDNLSPSETFAPSLFDQAADYAKSNPSSTAGLFGVEPAKPVHTIELDIETTKIIVEVPFEIASHLTKVNDVKLVESEALKLATLWRKPLERILSQYENSDIAIAALATLAIAGEKYAEYRIELERRNSSGNEGEGKDKLHQVQAA